MLDELFGSGALNLVYAASLGISFIFALVSLAGMGIGDAFDFDADVEMDIDGDGIDFAAISPLALAMFGGTFGLTGLVTRLWFDMGAVPSIALSFLAGLVVGALTQVFYVYVLSRSRSSHYSLSRDEVGRSAEVIISIPNEGVGTIAFDNVSGRVTLGARSLGGKQIAKGSAVRIEKISGRVAFVRPLELGESEERLLPFSAEDPIPQKKLPK